MENRSEQEWLRAARRAIAQRAWEEAAGYCRQVLQRNRRHAEAHYLVGIITGEMGHLATAIKAFSESLKQAPDNVQARIQLARCMVQVGDHNRAKLEADRARALVPDEARLQDLLGTVYSHIGLQDQALPLFQAAADQASEVELYQSNLAACALFLGLHQIAEAALQKVLAQNPAHYRSHWQLSRLKRASDTNHLTTMAALAADCPAEEVAYLHYALGKEHEDLQQWSQAWRHYQIAGNARCLQIQYKPEADRQLFQTLKEVYDPAWFEQQAAGFENEITPVFIIGMPRTGTTLVERILDSHSQIHSAGELQQFGIAVKQLARVPAPTLLDKAVASAAVTVDPAALGKRYLETTAFLRQDGKAKTAPIFIDKLPHNFLYLGLIAKALPKARFIHLRRHPLDTCLAIYKQLFAGAYPFSYRLEELGDYYVDYHQLMAHWQPLLGERLLSVDYETLVADQEGTTVQLLQHLGMEMEPACLTFYDNPRAVATASAAQVREKVYNRSVGLWRNFEDGLRPLVDKLQRKIDLS